MALYLGGGGGEFRVVVRMAQTTSEDGEVPRSRSPAVRNLRGRQRRRQGTSRWRRVCEGGRCRDARARGKGCV
jgi:hypothetical protein